MPNQMFLVMKSFFSPYLFLSLSLSLSLYLYLIVPPSFFLGILLNDTKGHNLFYFILFVYLFLFAQCIDIYILIFTYSSLFFLLLIYVLFNYLFFYFIFHFQGINARVRISGISKVELSLEELELVLQTLVYDGRLEEVHKNIYIFFLERINILFYFFATFF